MNKEILKEFLRLKRVEINEWIEFYFLKKILAPILATVTIVWMGASILFMASYWIGYIIDGNYIFDKFFLYLAMSSLIWISGLFIWLGNIVLEWLGDNWRQAKINVESRRNYE